MIGFDRRYAYLLALLIVAGAASLDPVALYGERTGAFLADEEMATAEMTAWTVDEAQIEVESGTRTTIDLAEDGTLRVAVLTTREFDATDVDRSTVRFEGAPPVQNGSGDVNGTDVDGDGDPDLVLDFRLRDLELRPGSSEAHLVGETLDGTGFRAVSEVSTAFGHSSNGTEVLLLLEPGSGEPEVAVENRSDDPEGSPPGEVIRTVDIETDNASYSEARLRLHYDAGTLGTPDDEISLWHLRNETWVPVDATVHRSNYVEADVSTLSVFALTEAYHDGFGGGAVSSDWSDRKESGYWYESDGVLVQDSRDTGILVNGKAADGLTNYTASVDMQKRGDDSHFASLLLRTDTAGDEAVEARLDWSNDAVELGYVEGGVYRSIDTLSVPDATGRGIWDEVRYRVDATVRGDAATVTVTAPSGSVTLNATSDQFYTGHSGVGLKALDGPRGDKNLFDQFVVEPVRGNSNRRPDANLMHIGTYPRTDP